MLPPETTESRLARAIAVGKHNDAVKRAVSVLASPNTVISSPTSTQMATGKSYNHAISQATPYTTLYEWLTGTGPRTRVFRDRDVFTEILKDHHHLDDVREEIVDLIRSGRATLNERRKLYFKSHPLFFNRCRQRNTWLNKT